MMMMGNTCEERNARERMGLFSINSEAAEEMKSKLEERKAEAEAKKAERAEKAAAKKAEREARAEQIRVEAETRRAEREAREAEAEARREARRTQEKTSLSGRFTEDKFLLAEEFFSRMIEEGHADRVREACEQLLGDVEVYEEKQKKLAALPQPCLVFVNPDTGQALRNREWEKNGQPTGFIPKVRWLFGAYISVFDVPDEVADAFHFGTYSPEDFEDEIADAITRYEALSGAKDN